MAKATVNSRTERVEKVTYEDKIVQDGLTLDLTIDEAMALRIFLGTFNLGAVEAERYKGYGPLRAVYRAISDETGPTVDSDWKLDDEYTANINDAVSRREPRS